MALMAVKVEIPKPKNRVPNAIPLVVIHILSWGCCEPIFAHHFFHHFKPQSFHSKVISGGGGTALRRSFDRLYANAANVENPMGCLTANRNNLRVFVHLFFYLILKVISNLHFNELRLMH